MSWRLTPAGSLLSTAWARSPFPSRAPGGRAWGGRPRWRDAARCRTRAMGRLSSPLMNSPSISIRAGWRGPPRPVRWPLVHFKTEADRPLVATGAPDEKPPLCEFIREAARGPGEKIELTAGIRGALSITRALANFSSSAAFNFGTLKGSDSRGAGISRLHHLLLHFTLGGVSSRPLNQKDGKTDRLNHLGRWTF